MEINWIIISIVSICAIGLIFFLIKRNAKDEKNLSKILDKNEYAIIDKDDAEEKDAEWDSFKRQFPFSRLQSSDFGLRTSTFQLSLNVWII